MRKPAIGKAGRAVAGIGTARTSHPAQRPEVKHETGQFGRRADFLVEVGYLGRDLAGAINGGLFGLRVEQHG